MSFFKEIINWLRGIKNSVATGFIKTRNWPVGAIISGQYKNFKHDSSPTILFMGTYTSRTGKQYVHGFNLHYMDQSDLQWLLKLIYMMKRGGQVVNPRQFYYYIKMNRPNIPKKCYRIYHLGFCNYYTVCPGFSNLSVKQCYSVKDGRDVMIKQLNQMIDNAYNPGGNNYTKPSRVAVDQKELQEHIQMVLNTRKIW